MNVTHQSSLYQVSKLYECVYVTNTFFQGGVSCIILNIKPKHVLKVVIIKSSPIIEDE
jgi:hypothetical protein